MAEKAEQGRRNAKYNFLPARIDDGEIKVVLASIMQSLKGWTARKCNLELNRKGRFWQHESFDHVIRDQTEWERTVNYVVNNPVKAGLIEDWQGWKWSYRRQQVIYCNSNTEQP